MSFSSEEKKNAYELKINNLELSLKEFADRKTTIESKPSRVMIELTRGFDHSEKMTPEMFERVGLALFESAYFVDLRGFGASGELKHWLKILSYIENYPCINWYLISNLPLALDDAWERMIKAGFIIGYSCHGATKETTEKLQPGSNFDVAQKNLEIASKTIKQLGSGFIFFIAMIENDNLNELPDIMKMAQKYGVPEVQITKKIGTKITAENRQEVINQAVEFGIQNKIRVVLNDQEFIDGLDPALVMRVQSIPLPPMKVPFPAPDEILDREFARVHPWKPLERKVVEKSKVAIYQRCFKPFHFVHVTPDGCIGPCNHLLEPETNPLGTLETASFDAIWNGKMYQEFRESLFKKTFYDKRCEWCFKYRLAD